MTTSWSHLMRGHVPSAFSTNVGGALLAFLALGAAPLCVVSAAKGKWLIKPPSDWVLAGAALTVAAITLIDWGIRLAGG